MDVEADEGAGWPTTPMPDLVPGPPGGAVLGCLKALGLVALLSAVGCVVVVFMVGRTLAPVGDVVGWFADGIGGDREDAEGRGGDGDGDGVLGPGDGADSQRLGVLVAPADGLRDGSVVTVASGSFAPAQIVGVTTCVREVLDPGGSIEGSCDLNEFATFAVPASGPVAVPYAIRRVATVGPDAIDCGAEAGRCVVVLTDMDAYRRSGFLPVTFAPGGPAPDLVPSGAPRASGGLPASATPTGPLADGTELTVEASGFVPGEPLQVSVCDDTFASASPTEACAELHDLNWWLGGRFSEEADRVDLAASRWRADGGGRATVVHAVASSFRPFGSGLGDQRDLEGPLVDCRASAGRCSIVVAAAADPTRAAVVPYELAGR